MTTKLERAYAKRVKLLTPKPRRRATTTELQQVLDANCVMRPSGCLEWTGRTQRGYGYMSVNGKNVGAHRISWSLANHQPVPKGKIILHSCDNPPCILPAHLRAGTYAENTADMISRGRGHNQQKTHCPQGHEYSVENTYNAPSGGRQCLACTIPYNREYGKTHRAQANKARKAHDRAANLARWARTCWRTEQWP